MIRLRRSRSKIDIHANFHGDTKRAFEKELLINQRCIRRGEIQKHTFNSNRWKPARKQLLAETGGKCAYCEAPISVVAFGESSIIVPKVSIGGLHIATTIISLHVKFVIRSSSGMLSRSKIEKYGVQ